MTVESATGRGDFMERTRGKSRFMVKSLVKKAVRGVGYEMHPVGALALGRTMGVALQHLRDLDFSPAFVVDVGVGDGTPDLYRCFPAARFLLIEPLREFQGAIARIARQVRADHVAAAAGERVGSITLRVHGDMLASSTLAETDGSDAGYELREVPVVTIDSVVEQHGLTGPALVKIDVQSGELAALRGAARTLETAEVVIAEVSMFQSHEGGPQFFDVLEFMQTSGFAAYDIFGGHCRPHDGALAQVDVVFVKEAGRFRSHHGYR